MLDVVRTLDRSGDRAARRLTVREPTLDDVFLTLTGHAPKPSTRSEDDADERAACWQQEVGMTAIATDPDRRHDRRAALQSG